MQLGTGFSHCDSPMLHSDPAKPVAPVAGTGAGPILSLHPIAGAWKRIPRRWDLEEELPGARRSRAGGIAMALGARLRSLG